MEKLVRASMNYTIGGLLGGVYYRELTRARGFTAGMPTQLRFFHSHCFTLGTFFFLIVLALEKLFKLSKQKNYKKFYITYNIGLGTTLLMMLVHGTLTVFGKDYNYERLIAWSAGVGHVFISIGFGFFFHTLYGAVADSESTSKAAKK